MRVLLLTLALVPALMFAGLYIGRQLADPMFPLFSDANTYLAAGERLNAGHDLYRLGPGDRYVLMSPETSDVPLLSPPPIAVLWRPLAALPFGFALWNAAAWCALLGAVAWVVLRFGALGAVVIAAMAPVIGEQLAAGNMIAFFPALLFAAWHLRGSMSGGAIAGVLAGLKLSPAALFGWVAGSGDPRAIVGAAVGLSAVGLVTVVGAGLGSVVQYIEVARGIRYAPDTSVSAILGLPWASIATLVLGTALAWLVSRRSPAGGFAIAVFASVLGTPALYGSTLVTLLAAFVPFGEPRSMKAAGAIALAILAVTAVVAYRPLASMFLG